MWTISVTTLQAVDCTPDTMERIVLKDGRTLNGWYDDELQVIIIPTGASKAQLKTPPETIQSRTRLVEPPPEKSVDELLREANRAQVENAERIKAASEAAALREAAIRAESKRAQAEAERQRLADEERLAAEREVQVRAEARRRAQRYEEMYGLKFNPQLLTAEEMDIAAEQPVAEIERKREAVESKNREIRRQKEAELERARVEAAQQAYDKKKSAERERVQQERDAAAAQRARMEYERQQLLEKKKQDALIAMMIVVFGTCVAVVVAGLPALIAHRRLHPHRVPIDIITAVFPIALGITVGVTGRGTLVGAIATIVTGSLCAMSWTGCLAWACWPGMSIPRPTIRRPTRVDVVPVNAPDDSATAKETIPS